MREKEFFNLVEDTKGLVLSTIRKYLAKQYYHSIDDVVQETYIRVYKGLKKNIFSDISSRNNWIYTITKNESIRMTEKLNREEMKILRIRDEKLNGQTEFMDKFNEEIIEIRDIISTLPDKYRIVFELLVLGFSEKQIAEKLSMKKGTVKSRIHRGKELIHRTSKRRGIDYELH